MKNKLMLALLGLLLVLVGCSQEETLLNNDVVSRCFTVALNSNVETRGAVELRNASAVPTRYIMEVYEGATAAGNPILRKEQFSRVFDHVILTDKQAYTVLFWADMGTPTETGGTPAETNEYDASDLKAARVASGKQATIPAYAGCSKFTVGKDDEAVYSQVTLSHAVAKVQYKQNELLTSTENTLVVTYPKSYSLNVDGMGTTEIPGELCHSFTYNVSYSGTLGTDYLIAATGVTNTVMDLTSEFTSGGVKTTKQLTSVPFRCNYQTSIYSAYSDLYNAGLTVACNDQWESTDNLVEFPKPKLGDYYYSDNTYSTVRNTSKSAIGVIFWIDGSNPQKGRIVSLDEGNDKWSTAEVVTGVDDYSGIANMTEIKDFTSNDLTNFPAFRWCDDKNTPAIAGIQWYLPSFNDFNFLYDWLKTDIVANNAIITNSGVVGAVGINANGHYWTSWEISNSTAVKTNVIYEGWDVFSKSSSFSIRAVSYFTAL